MSTPAIPAIEKDPKDLIPAFKVNIARLNLVISQIESGELEGVHELLTAVAEAISEASSQIPIGQNSGFGIDS